MEKHVARHTSHLTPHTSHLTPHTSQVIHDIHKDDGMQLDLVWMGSATVSGAGAMDLALLRCCQRIDDNRFTVVSTEPETPNNCIPNP